MRTKLLKTSVVVALLAILLGMIFLWPTHRIMPEFFQKIRVGMTEGEVEQLLRAKAGNHDGYHGCWATDLTIQPDHVTLREWCGRNGFVRIYFESGRVAHFDWDHRTEPATWWARTLERLAPRPKAAPVHFEFQHP